MAHRTMRGKMIDMDKLMRQNELMPAIGNMKVNARGDQLGPGGQIVKKHEEVVAEYYHHNPKARVQTKTASAPATESDELPAQPQNSKPASSAPKKVPVGE
jgi:hypothetical protein